MTTFNLLVALRQMMYFQEMDATALQTLAQSMPHYHYHAGEIIFMEGDTATGLHLIEHGRVKIYKLNPDGEEHVLHLLGDGNTFNDIAALDNGINPANAAALSDVTIWVLPAAALHAAMLADSRLALRVVRILAARVRTLVRQIEDVTLYSVIVRLARFLLKQGEDPALSGPGVTRATIAAHLATTPESVSRALRTLADNGVIEFDRHRIVITRPDLLKTIASL